MSPAHWHTTSLNENKEKGNQMVMRGTREYTESLARRGNDDSGDDIMMRVVIVMRTAVITEK